MFQVRWPLFPASVRFRAAPFCELPVGFFFVPPPFRSPLGVRGLRPVLKNRRQADFGRLESCAKNPPSLGTIIFGVCRVYLCSVRPRGSSGSSYQRGVCRLHKVPHSEREAAGLPDLANGTGVPFGATPFQHHIPLRILSRSFSFFPIYGEPAK